MRNEIQKWITSNSILAPNEVRNGSKSRFPHQKAVSLAAFLLLKENRMIDTEKYITQLICLLRQEFSTRLIYVGLQGSYMRGEADDNSDIDIMAVIDNLGVSDLESYRSIIQSIDHSDKSCGFICGVEDLKNWNPLEICHLLHTTHDYFGTLSELVPEYTENDIRNFVNLSVNNLYHELCHRYIHSTEDRNISALPGTYKAVFFILQNLYYIKLGMFAATKSELLNLTEGIDREVLMRSIELKNNTDYDFHESLELLFNWCRKTIAIL